MCQECGCEDFDNKTITIDKSLTEKNDKIAHDTWHNLQNKKILCVNVLGAPGSGKTSLIEGLAKHIPPNEIAVIQGDLESNVDKERLEEQNISTFQINTHSGCHLTAQLVADTLLNINLACKKYVFIENVGNLVCPAGVKIGQHLDLVVSATTEGSDKPKKYPIIFDGAKLVIISKYNLAEAVEFDEEQYVTDVKEINNTAKIVKTTKKTESFKAIAHFLEHEREHLIGHVHKH